MIEKDEFHRLLDDIVKKSNESVRLILREQDLRSINSDSLASATTRTFPNYDDSLLITVSELLSKGNQIAIQAAGPDELLVLAAPNLFHKAGTEGKFQSLLGKLDQLSAKYPSSQGEPLFQPKVSYIKPVDQTALAKKFAFNKVASFPIDDHAAVDEIEKYLKKNLIVILAGYTQENRADVWVQPEQITKEKKSGCFIATASFDDEFAPEVIYLRRFRNHVMNKSKKGRTFVHMYYLLSPPIARVISKSFVLKVLTREIFLKPIIKLLSYLYPTRSINKRK